MFGWYKFVGEYEFILYVDVVVGYEGYLCDNGFVLKKKLKNWEYFNGFRF